MAEISPPRTTDTKSKERPVAQPSKGASGAKIMAEAETQEQGGWNVHPSDVPNEAMDPLLGCLVSLTRFFDNPQSGDALTAGLPLVDGLLTPGLFERAAERIGISTRMVKRRLKRIPSVVLPAVLLLKGRSACVLTRWVNKTTAEIMLPETGSGTREINIKDLEKLYSGHAIFAKPEYHFRRQEEVELTPEKGSWFWGTLWSFWPIYGQVALAAFLVNCFALASPLFIMNVYDRVVPNQAFETLWVLAIGISTVIIFDFILRSLRAYFVDTAGKKADVLLSSRMFEQVLNLKMKARPASSGSFANHLREFEQLRSFFTSATLVALADLPFLGLFLLVIWKIGGPVAYIPAAAVPIIIILGLLFQLPLRRAIRQSLADSSLKHGVIVETLNALETVKSLGAEGRMQREWERFVGSSAQVSLRARNISGLAIHLSTFVQQLVTVGVIIVGVFQIAKGEMTIGALIACTILSGRTMAPLAQLAALLSRLNQSIAALDTLNAIMALPVERKPGQHPVSHPHIKGEIEFQNVKFSYPGSPIAALNDVSFHITPGERVGVIGPVASGKTTIIKLMLGLYEPDEGAVLLDGMDIRQMDPADIRRAIGAVMQESILFQGTVKENISIAAPYADDDMILRAATLSGVHSFISHHPMGYDLMVGERGQTLSGGQRQAIALARALLQDPQMLLLDEPTSSMDLRTENELTERMLEVLPGRTLLMCSHRPSWFKLVDRLIVLGQGKVVADGPKDEILRAGQRQNVKSAVIQSSTPKGNRP